MPYVSVAELERARWMTLRNTIAFVMQRDRCTRRAALRQIRAARGDGKLFARWEDERPDFSNPDGIMIAPDRPPRNWQSVAIRGDKLLDPWTGCWRVVLLSRFSVESVWPAQSAVPPLVPPKPHVQRTDHREADARLVTEMRTLIANGKAKNATDAARAVVGRAAGSGSDGNKVKRLVRRYYSTVGART